jgi:hypothetical protein
MRYLAPFTALVCAAGLLALQILGAIEYTAGGTLYTQASMIAAMVAVAVLPLMIEWAWHRKAKGAAAAMSVALVAFLAYSLPATTGRTGEAKEAKANTAGKALEDKARVQADYDATKKLVDESNKWQPKACAGGVGKDCKSATFILNQRQASLEKLAKQLEGFQAAPPGDLGSSLWAGVLRTDEDRVRKGSIIAYALGLEAGIFGLMWFFGRGLRAITETTPSKDLDAEAEKLKRYLANDPGPPLPPTRAIVPDLKGENIVPWAQAFEAKHGRKPRLDEALAAYPDVARTTCWRRLKAA